MKQGQQTLKLCIYEKEDRYDNFKQQNVTLMALLCSKVILFKENLPSLTPN